MTTWGETLSIWYGSGDAIKDYKKVKKTVKGARDALKKARQCSILMESVKEFRKETDRVDKYLGSISTSIDKAESVYQAVEDAKKIRVAMLALKDGNLMRYDPEGAAAAFGVLFHGFGGFATHLPSPAKGYGQALQAIGSSLSKIVRFLDPHSRPGWGNQLKQLNIQIGQYR